MADPEDVGSSAGRLVGYVGIGSNIRPDVNVGRAVALLKERAAVTGVSTFYRTAPVGAPGSDEFINGVIRVEWAGQPSDLPRILDRVEREMGRRRTEDRFAPRIIDLDLLMVEGSREMPAHPDVTRRDFVALPLLELAPNLVLPDGTPLSTVAAAFDDPPGTPLPALTDALRQAVSPV